MMYAAVSAVSLVVGVCIGMGLMAFMNFVANDGFKLERPPE